ncbi:MAG: SUMF1/EgtB/PvdO family nonheme iron enzyme [Lewinellaceae bacterium]|nr:SUMF1/EgtB/PvdO family nonheme iron enzyme [Lewinellaceae bacterium]MCB9333290.1 SUMF1/EgtB/PvdO family nonheme iron enzyme [Lewinellaceae bacterium]
MKRYPGIRPFRTDEQGLFFGRDADIARLHRLIELEQLVILYGKSGYGKSSLLAAGIFPKLEKEAKRRFLEIRFGPHKAGESTAPADAVRHALARHAGPDPLLPDSMAGHCIWQAAKNCQQPGQANFLLVFDQFEELFSYPPEQILDFKKQLAEALYAKVPRRFETALAAAKLSPEAEDAIYTPFDLKVVFSIRSDRMSLLNGLKDYLPNLLQHGYELDALDEAGAREAILRPAALLITDYGLQIADSNLPGEENNPQSVIRNPQFDTPPFTYAPETLAAIFNALRDDRGRIETSALQIVCRYVEDYVVGPANPTPSPSPRGEGGMPSTVVGHTEEDSQKASHSTNQQETRNEAPLPRGGGDGGGVEVSLADLGDIPTIFRQFYERTIANLPEAEQAPARRLVEDQLVKDGVRVPYAAQALLAQPGISQELLGHLSAASLLRVQRDEAGRMIYEVGHDTLVGPIEEAAKARREAELQAAERTRLEQEAARQKAEREKIARARRRNALFSIVALLLLGWALWQNIQANRQKAIAEERTAAAEEAERRADQKDSLARDARVKADTAQAIAKRKTEEASQNAEATAQAMLRLGKSTAQVVDALVKEVNSHIYHLEYNEALRMMEDAAKFDKPTPDFKRAALELAFYHNEAGEKQAGLTARALALLHQAPLKSREQCNDYLRRADADWYKTLTEKYYPLMLPVVGGDFLMGCDSTRDKECFYDERPQHIVHLSNYQIASTETTFWQWGLYCADKGLDLRKFSPSWGLNGDNPVVFVDWFHAVEYANWLSVRFGKSPMYRIDSLDKESRGKWEVSIIAEALEKGGFRLPTEAEWEYAARGGPNKYRYLYAGSNYLAEAAWYVENSDSLGIYRTHPVATRKPLFLSPEYRLYDMSGNVWEWCWDAYDRFSLEPVTNPKGPERRAGRVGRGGSWKGIVRYCRVSNRKFWTPILRDYETGFRLASSPQ